jgi:hypothetical protein
VTPFDASRAEGRVRVVRTAAVLDLLPLTHAPERIAEYADAMRRGDRFPPVSVLPLAGRLLLADGHKRLAACRALAVDEIPVEVWTYARWLRDQVGQLRRNAAKNREIAARAFRDPREAARLLGTTLGHWRRVALSLATLARRRGAGGP